MIRAVLTRLFRSFLWMLAGAAIIAGAQLYGPGLLAAALPAGLRLDPAALDGMTTERIMDAIKDIRGALE